MATVEWRGDGVYLDGRRLSAEEAAPYWDAIAPFTKKDMAGKGETRECVVTRVDYNTKTVTYGPAKPRGAL